MSQAGITAVTEIGPTIPVEFVTNSGTAVASFGVINILGSGGVSTNASGNTINIVVSGSGFSWNVVTSAMNPVTLVAENGYICKGASPVNFILPASASIGDSFKIIGYGNLWTISQNAGQTITIGFITTTAGVTGSIQATMISDGLEMVCVTSNLEFFETYIQGNPILN